MLQVKDLIQLIESIQMLCQYKSLFIWPDFWLILAFHTDYKIEMLSFYWN